MPIPGLKETLDRLTKANGVLRYGHALNRDSDVLSKPMDFKVVERSRSTQDDLEKAGERKD